MGNRGRNRRDDLPIQASVNITSLVDVAFTLLIIFVITAPALQGRIDVDLPDLNAPPSDVANPLQLTITREGGVILEDVAVEVGLLEEALARSIAPGQVVSVAVDEVAPAGVLVDVQWGISRAGGRIVMETEPESGRDR